MAVRVVPGLLIVAALAGCGSSGGADTAGGQSTPTPAGTTAPSAPKGAFHVAGTYDTAVTLESSTCSNVTVQPNPTTVEHAPSATSLKLTHAGHTYDGYIAASGRFFTKPKALSQGKEYSILRIEGNFSTTGFDAKVNVSVSNPKCEYVVHWVGTKQGAPNIIG